MIAARGLYLAAALFGVTGVGLRLAPAGAPGAQAAPALPASTPTAMAASQDHDPGRYGAIIASGVFLATRTAPSSRLVPAGARNDTAAAPPRPKATAPRIHLYGITGGVGGALALIDADPKVPGAEIYRVGDLVRGARISSITDSTVMIARPSGQLVLRLPELKGEPR